MSPLCHQTNCFKPMLGVLIPVFKIGILSNVLDLQVIIELSQPYSRLNRSPSQASLNILVLQISPGVPSIIQMFQGVHWLIKQKGKKGRNGRGCLFSFTMHTDDYMWNRDNCVTLILGIHYT